MENNNNTNPFGSIPTSVIVLLCIFLWPIGILLLILKYSNKNTAQFQTYKNLNVAQNNFTNSTNTNILKNKKTSARAGAIIAFVLGALFFVVMCEYLFFGGEHLNERNTTSSTNTYKNTTINTTPESNTTVHKQVNFTTMAVAGVLAALCFVIGVCKWIKSARIGNKIQRIEIYQNIILVRNIYDVDEIARYFNTSKIKVLDEVSDMLREGYINGIKINQNKIEKIPDYIDPNRIFNIKCPSCGANNKYIKGQENKCEYCGTILNLDK